MVKEKKLSKSNNLSDIKNIKSLVLFNDDINTFEFVINCLVDICQHSPDQAEQCALVTHFNGKCEIKVGAENQLKVQHKKLINKGLKTSIE